MTATITISIITLLLISPFLAFALADRGATLWFKAASMQQGILDHKQEREIQRDRADLAIEAGRAQIEEGRKRLADKVILKG